MRDGGTGAVRGFSDKTSEFLRKYGIPLKKSLGQHFLSNAEFARRIVQLAGVGPDDVVLEIGAGAGTLTIELCKTGAKVFAVEIDRRLEPILKERCSEFPNLELIFDDFLKLDISFLPSGYRCVSNIPYNITGPILKRLVFTDFRDLVLMVQSEVGERLLAPPGSRERGFLTVILQTIAHVEKLTHVPRSAFVPNPDVESLVIRAEKRPALPFQSADELADYWAFVSNCFANKRKTIFNNLRSFLPSRIAEVVLEDTLRRFRPEELTEEQFTSIWRKVRTIELAKFGYERKGDESGKD